MIFTFDITQQKGQGGGANIPEVSKLSDKNYVLCMWLKRMHILVLEAYLKSLSKVPDYTILLLGHIDSKNNIHIVSR